MEKKTTIGKLIEYEVRKKGLPITEFAKLICCKRSNVYNIFERCTMDIVQLKRISEVLNRNFFKELADDLDLIDERELSDEERNRERAVSQFFAAVPDALYRLGKSASIIFLSSKAPELEGIRVPDFGLLGYFITFTRNDTMKERWNGSPFLSVVEERNEDGCEVEVVTNLAERTTSVNIKLDYKTEEEWYRLLKYAFEIYEKYGGSVPLSTYGS